ncbi:MAG: nucleotidyltransferase domain-containing protein [Bacteroidetes bacterium]|nr:nucleotidyltransferase domain-containing protein [Bacteroidota bacterium]MBU1421902.1 nucleotidyltransferase domain-containing protein [Bacteroidota bacterium]MBU2472154.1 nucleotidyltransferase domain-containing protein [Bacteroidota bacterium]MBU2635991.1 nucleotidyltransferase domain-containing protein [Bacteroidota bacterium]
MKRNNHITIKEIRSIAKRIAEKFDTEKIIQFGSYAYGKPTEHSDIDFLIIAKSKVHHAELRYQIYSELKDIPHPYDVVIREPQQLETAKQRRDWFLLNIIKRGRLVYARC